MITIRYLIAKTCILLFFSVLASKSRSLLITIEVIQNRKNKPSQTNFDSNVAIRTFDHEPSALKNKLFQTIRFMGNVVTLHYPSETNRIQREFLFNNCIQSQEFSSASKPPRQKTNLLKRRPAFTPLSMQWGGVGGGDCAKPKIRGKQINA
jgi:hypothetical protein